MPRTPPREAPGAVHLLLRQSTHTAHTRLNHHPMLAGITQPGYPLARYVALLAAYQPLYAGLESAIVARLSTIGSNFDYSQRHKLPWLNEDLQFFTHAIPDRPAALAPLDNLGQLVGTLYVIEGSTLGGELIARQIAQHLGLERSAGARFFNAYGAQTQTRWQEFCRFMASLDDDPEMLTSAVHRAEQTFCLFTQALDLAARQLGILAPAG